MLSRVSEILTNGASGIGSQELERGGIRGSSSDDGSVSHGAVSVEHLDNVGNSGSLLTNSDVDAVEFLDLIVEVEGMLLVNDGVDSNGSFSSLSITNNQFSLASSNWHQGIDGLESGLHGLVHRLSWDDTWGFEFDSLSVVGLDWSSSIDGGSERVDNSSKHIHTNGNIDNRSSSLDNITLLDLSIVTQHDNTDVVSLQVESHTLNTGAELHHFSCLDLHESEHSGNTISNRDDSSEFFQVVL